MALGWDRDATLIGQSQGIGRVSNAHGREERLEIAKTLKVGTADHRTAAIGRHWERLVVERRGHRGFANLKLSGVNLTQRRGGGAAEKHNGDQEQKCYYNNLVGNHCFCFFFWKF